MPPNSILFKRLEATNRKWRSHFRLWYNFILYLGAAIAMVTQLLTQTPIIYPDCDGQPIANNTTQFRWIVTIKQNLEWIFANDDVFVAGDLFWYPIEGKPSIVVAPDVMVAIGRPKGDRKSYQQWNEANIAPQVVFEIISPSNTVDEMDMKLLFFDRYGVEEYYIYDPQRQILRVFLRQDEGLQIVPWEQNWTSPRLGIHFEMGEDALVLRRPDGAVFQTFEEITLLLDRANQRAAEAERRS
ncbi:MAG: Uma2 family endonuclease, partial [Pseudanabaena sp.]